MKIGIGLKKNAYTPEAYAYSSYLSSRGWDVQLSAECNLDPELDMHLYFMGIRPFWRKSTNDTLEVHEYQSASTPPYSIAKNWLKGLVNRKPTARIFLNSLVEKSFSFDDDLPSLHRDMGVDAKLFLPTPLNPEYDLVYCGSILGRVGLIEEINRLASIGLKILIVGHVDKHTSDLFGGRKGVTFAGMLARHDLPQAYRMARAGLNFTPDIYPFNIQTSTKTLEYCAAGLGVVSNRYEWVQQFEHDRGGSFLWLEKLNTRGDVEDFSYRSPDVRDLEWHSLLDRASFSEFLSLAAQC